MSVVELLRVLVVDDEERPRQFLEDLMRGRGHVVTSASSLEEAVSALAQGPFDLVVMDLNLPVSVGRVPQAEHGYALETRVRAVCPKGRTYLIVLTGKGVKAMDSSLAHDHGCDAYVLKGDRERLLRKVSEGEAQARLRHGSRRPKGSVPLKAQAWRDCSLLLEEGAALARTRTGGEARIQPSEGILNALYQFLWAPPEEGSDLKALLKSEKRLTTLARDVRKLLRETFEVAEGGDPLPRQRARKTWLCRVRLRERETELGVDYEELRRRDHFEPDAGR